MKKMLFLIMITVLCLSIIGCGSKKGNKPDGEIETENLSVEVLSCAFDEEVMGLDEEISSYGFTKRDGKVYVNVALKITNKGTKAITKEDIKGYFEYGDLRNDLQYELMSVAPVNNNDDSIPQGCIGIVYMLTSVDEAAQNEEITVHLTIDGKEHEEKVSPIDTRSAFEKKTKVAAGDKINVEGLYDVEVISCKETQYIQATNYSESEQYKAFGNYKIYDLLLKVKNNTDVDFIGISGYAPVNGTFSWADVKIEINNNTELKDLDDTNGEALKPGQEEYIHVCAMVKPGETPDNSAVRFNIAGNCYYCVIE